MAANEAPNRDQRSARNEKLEKQIQGGQERRRAALANEKPVQPSANPLPAARKNRTVSPADL
jgi:hypothetical protein